MTIGPHRRLLWPVRSQTKLKHFPVRRVMPGAPHPVFRNDLPFASPYIRSSLVVLALAFLEHILLIRLPAEDSLRGSITFCVSHRHRLLDLGVHQKTSLGYHRLGHEMRRQRRGIDGLGISETGSMLLPCTRDFRSAQQNSWTKVVDVRSDIVTPDTSCQMGSECSRAIDTQAMCMLLR